MSLDSRPRNYDRHSWCGRESRNSRKRDLSLPKCTKTVFPDTSVTGNSCFQHHWDARGNACWVDQSCSWDEGMESPRALTLLVSWRTSLLVSWRTSLFWSCSRLYCGFEKVCDLEDIRIESDQSFGGSSWGSHVPQALLCCEASIVSLESDYLTSWNLRIFLSLHRNKMCVWMEPIKAGRESSTGYN